ncbi:MAG: alpha/beta hydrolase [Hyphomicrobiales bacterium]|nr:MAG: alpha/beta hydrolase [Hyphomicrobiales bacterium]
MEIFTSGDLEIAYQIQGEGEPILLIHGFASNAAVNWQGTGWVDLLLKSGRQVIMLDNRGHGRSAKPYIEAAYDARLMAGDALNLLDHLGLPAADVMGYSMGARITAFLAMAHPDRVRSAIFGGLGENMILGTGDPEPIVRALEAPSLEAVTDKRGRMFRRFAERTGSDLRALALCMRSERPKVDTGSLAALPMPVLVVCGSEDSVSGSAENLARLIPQGRAVTLPGKDHMNAVGDKGYKQAVLEFLETRA